MTTTLVDVKKQLEDLTTYPDFSKWVEGTNLYSPDYYHGYNAGAQEALASMLNWVSMRIEHDRGRG